MPHSTITVISQVRQPPLLLSGSPRPPERPNPTHSAPGRGGAAFFRTKARSMSERSQAHAAQARADLERTVAALRDSDAWRRNLAVMAQFHRYSEPVS